MSEKDIRIRSPELAHHMAVAEKPYRELALHAFSIGANDTYNTALIDADQAGMKKGRKYLDELSTNLDEHKDAMETEPVKDIYVSELSLRKFTQENNYSSGYCTYVWGGIVHSAWEADDNKSNIFDTEDVSRNAKGDVVKIRLNKLADMISYLPEDISDYAKKRYIESTLGLRRFGVKYFECLSGYIDAERNKSEVSE